VFKECGLTVMFGWISPSQLPMGEVAMDNIKYVVRNS